MTTTAGKSAERTVGDETKADVLGGAGEILQSEQVNEFVAAAVANAGLENQRVCVVVPDGTRTCPLPLLLQAVQEGLADAAHVSYLDHPVRRVLSIMPTKYEDIWTAAKGFTNWNQ
jgi:hypothetical protein